MTDQDLEWTIRLARADIARRDLAAAKQGLALIGSQMNDGRPERIQKQFREMIHEGASLEKKYGRVRGYLAGLMITGVLGLAWLLFVRTNPADISRDLFECKTTVYKTLKDEPMYSQVSAVQLCMQGHDHALVAKCYPMEAKCWN